MFIFLIQLKDDFGNIYIVYGLHPFDGVFQSNVFFKYDIFNINWLLQRCSNPRLGFKFQFVFTYIFIWCMCIQQLLETHAPKTKKDIPIISSKVQNIPVCIRIIEDEFFFWGFIPISFKYIRFAYWLVREKAHHIKKFK